MVSKYYKSKGMTKRIYFSNDKIQEMNYYLLTDPKQNYYKED